MNSDFPPEQGNDDVDDDLDFSGWPLVDFAMNAPQSSLYVYRVYRGEEYKDVLDLLQRTRDSAIHHFLEETSQVPLGGMFERATRVVLLAPEVDGDREILADIKFE